MTAPSFGVVTAKRLRAAFAAKKRKLICEALAETRTKQSVLDALEKLYKRQTTEYLRCEPTTYAQWLEHGPRVELEEVNEAIRLDRDHVWDRLVDRTQREVAREIGGAA